MIDIGLVVLISSAVAINWSNFRYLMHPVDEMCCYLYDFQN